MRTNVRLTATTVALLSALAQPALAETWWLGSTTEAGAALFDIERITTKGDRKTAFPRVLKPRQASAGESDATMLFDRRKYDCKAGWYRSLGGGEVSDELKIVKRTLPSLRKSPPAQSPEWMDLKLVCAGSDAERAQYGRPQDDNFARLVELNRPTAPGVAPPNRLDTKEAALAALMVEGCIPYLVDKRPLGQSFRGRGLPSNLRGQPAVLLAATETLAVEQGAACYVRADKGDGASFRRAIVEAIQGAVDRPMTVKSDGGPEDRDGVGRYRQEIHCFVVRGRPGGMVISSSDDGTHAALQATTYLDAGQPCDAR